MYTPKHFRVTDQEAILNFIRSNGFGQLVSLDRGQNFRLDSSYLPFLINDDCSQLTAHMARQNPQWQDLEDQEVLITFLGPHSYVSPSWYNSPGVPTWNYQVVNIYGKFSSFTDNAKLSRTVKSLSEIYESDFAAPWQPEFSAAQLNAIVGIKIEINEIQAKFKLSQNRSKEDQMEVIRKLRDCGSQALADAMEKNL